MSGRWCAEQDGYWWKIGTTHTAVIETPGMVKQLIGIPRKETGMTANPAPLRGRGNE